MVCERPNLPGLIEFRERRIGDRLDERRRAYDPVEEINRRLSLNDHLEAGCLTPVTSNRSLAWPFTPLLGFRLSTRESIAMAYIGVDLHTTSFTICRLDLDGSERFETFQLAPGDLARFRSGLSPADEIAVEATGNTAFFCDAIRPAVCRVVVVNPSRFKVIRASVAKTDRNDARALAVFLSKDMLPETRAKSVAESELASLTQTRDVLVKQRTMLLNKLHAIFVRHGMKLKKESLGSKRALERLQIGPFSTVEQVELRVLRDQALALTATLKGLDREIEAAASTMEGYEGLVSIKGIGPRSAAILLSSIGDVRDFQSADRLAAYFGMVPKVNQSNETDHRGRITKRGNKLARTTLVQCALIAIRYSGYLNAFYRRIKARRGAGKAIIATARKLLKIVFDTLRNGWVFEDFANFKIQGNSIPYGQTS